MTPKYLSGIAAGLLMLGTTSLAFADGHGCALSYEIYEHSVPHTDMEECPAGLAAADSFCRLSIMAEVATVFVFSEETSCPIKAQAFEEDPFDVTFQ